MLVAAPRPLDLRPPVNRATRRDVWFDYDNAILQQRYVLDLIGATTGRCKGAAAELPDELPLHVCAVARNADTTATPAEPPTFPGKDDYIILHVVNWNSTSGSGLTVSKQNWYVYNIDPDWDYTAFTGNRIFGKKQLYLYTIHLNVPTGTTYQERYAVDEKYKTPAFLNHLVAIGQLFGLGSSGQGRLVVPDNWYAFRLDVKYIPSDLTITPTMMPDSLAAPASTPEPVPAPPPPPPPPASADPAKMGVSSLGAPATVPVAGAPQSAGSNPNSRTCDSAVSLTWSRGRMAAVNGSVSWRGLRTSSVPKPVSTRTRPSAASIRSTWQTMRALASNPPAPFIRRWPQGHIVPQLR